MVRSSSIFLSWFPQAETEPLPGWWGHTQFVIQSSKNSVRQGEQWNLRWNDLLISSCLTHQEPVKWSKFPKDTQELLATGPIQAWGTQPIWGPAASREARIYLGCNNWTLKWEKEHLFLAPLWVKLYNMQFLRHPVSRGQCNVLERWFY